MRADAGLWQDLGSHGGLPRGAVYRRLPYSKEHRKRAFTREMIRPSGVKTPKFEHSLS
jgi:hypothetical protein